MTAMLNNSTNHIHRNQFALITYVQTQSNQVFSNTHISYKIREHLKTGDQNS
jgi:hypothetical protein